MHLLAFSASIAAATVTEITPVNDQVWFISSSRFLTPQTQNLLAFASFSANLQRVRQLTPYSRRIVIPFMQGVNDSALPPAVVAIDDFTSYKRPIIKNEQLAFDAIQGGGVAEQVTAFAWVGDGVRPAPVGESYIVRGTATNAITTNTWSDLTMSWDTDLPNGLYSVVGGWYYGTGAQAFRMIFQNQIDRPGGLGKADFGNVTPPLQLDGKLGEWGQFVGESYPNIQAFCNAATVNHQVYLQVVKIR